MSKPTSLSLGKRLGPIAVLVLVPLASACSGAAARHMQYDYGRCFSEAVVAQADLTRPSVANLEHPLAGVEAAAIRLRVSEAATDAESGESEMTTQGLGR